MSYLIVTTPFTTMTTDDFHINENCNLRVIVKSGKSKIQPIYPLNTPDTYSYSDNGGSTICHCKWTTV